MSTFEVLTFVCLGTPFCRRSTSDDRHIRLVVGLAFFEETPETGQSDSG